MMIEFQCGNLTTTGNQKVVCGNRIIVSDELIGELVTCAKCRQTVEVPVVTRSAREPTRPRRQTVPRRRRPTKSNRKSDNKYRLAEPINLAKADLAEYGEQPAASGYLDAAPQTQKKIDRPHCDRCGAMMDKSGRCNSCGAREKKSEHVAESVDDVRMALAGFQLWFVTTIGEAIPFFMLEWALHFAVFFITAGMSIAALALLGFFPGILFVLLILIVAGIYAGMAVNGHRLVTNPNAKLAWLQSPFWYGLLKFARLLKWQGYDSNLSGRTIIDMRRQPVTDHQIQKIDDIGRCEVLDLEGTLITDEGLRHLQNIKTLKCLVVRETDVSRAAVLRLQQSRRRLWIWH